MEIVQQSLPNPKNRPVEIVRHITQLKQQIETCWLQQSFTGFDVCCDHRLPADGNHRDKAGNGKGLPCLVPALIVVPRSAFASIQGRPAEPVSIPWAIDIVASEAAPLRTSSAWQALPHQYAQYQVGEYWLMDISTVELRIYRHATTAGYRQYTVRQVGEAASPIAFPQLTLAVQEPLPLFFLTRTTHGQHTDPVTLPPLCVRSQS